MAFVKFVDSFVSGFKQVDNAAAAIKPAGNSITLAKVIDEPVNVGKITDDIRIVSNQPVYVPSKVVQNTAPQTLYVVEKAADPVMTDMSRVMNEAADILTKATAKTGGSSVLGNLGKVAKAAGVGALGYVAGSALLGGSQVLTPEIPDPGPAPFVEKEDDGTITYITENFDAVNGALGFLQEQIDAIGDFLNELVSLLFGDQSGGTSSGSGGGLILTGGDSAGGAASSPARKILMIGGAAAVLIGIIYLITKRGKGNSKKGGGKK